VAQGRNHIHHTDLEQAEINDAVITFSNATFPIKDALSATYLEPFRYKPWTLGGFLSTPSGHSIRTMCTSSPVQGELGLGRTGSGANRPGANRVWGEPGLGWTESGANRLSAQPSWYKGCAWWLKSEHPMSTIHPLAASTLSILQNLCPWEVWYPPVVHLSGHMNMP